MNLFDAIDITMDVDIPSIVDLNTIAEYLGVDEIQPVDIIEDMASVSSLKELNGYHVGNAHLSLLFSKIKEKDPDVSYVINAQDSYLLLRGQKITSLDCYLKARES